MNEKPVIGVEIGGTKLQVGCGFGESGTLAELLKANVNVAEGAQGIQRQIHEMIRELRERHDAQQIGVGFGGPVDVATGQVFKSHQISGWDGVPLGEELHKAFGIPVRVDNDCNVAALGEAKLGAGQGRARVFYVTVGTGIGGGLVVDGSLDGNTRPAIAEIGHLRPGPTAESPEQTVESLASGWGIEAWTRKRLQNESRDSTLLQACNGDLSQLTAVQIGAAALEGDSIALEAIDQATRVLGWAIAQVVTLTAPEVVVVGGGVSLIGDLFFTKLREQARRYSFGPLIDSYEILPAQLGSEVVVHGAIQLFR